ncbi:regulation of nuclear pre-mRNA domain-containing protein 2-like [Saccostrea echinata]|uniref:regulation of nuclear pre-mRNA domain-containing protein 2-like n=1 Tax=Saccostrea echinata TaxID=191078 RepID=UPI002A7FB5E5|nr:regulation of nuclear pre-mRNA domain-containing protein 2-like [Saccostrea echinata]
MASPSHKMSEENLEKKMLNVSNTQDSIQSLSLWLIHHKSHHKRVVDVWLNTFKKVPSKQKLVLFNLCNDVCQNGKRKRAGIYIESFKTVLTEAIAFSRDKSIQPNIGRILKIWGERSIFPKGYLDELTEMLMKDSPAPTPVGNNAVSPATPAGSTPATPTQAYKPTTKIKDEEKILAEFKPQMLIDKINSYKRLEGEVELKFKQISSLKLDASSVEAVSQLKDRAHGKQFSQQFEDSCSKLENYVSSAEQQIQEQKVMIELLEQSQVFYDEQYREARIVANAYKNFGTRINNLRKKLEDLMKSLPSPVPSPSYDAPSPGNTPPLEEIDNTEAVDMDLDDDDNPAASTILAAQQSASISNNMGSSETEVYDPEEQMSSKPKYVAGPNALESRIATMIPSLPTGSVQHTPAVQTGSIHHNVDPRSQLPPSADNPPVYIPPKPTVIKVLQQEGGTPTKDEGSSTPVMDEKEDSPPRSHQNPIDFLTQILSKTPKASTPSSNFLQNLSLLTNTVKSQFQHNRDVVKQPQAPLQPPASETPNSWAEWKAQMKPEEVPQAAAPALGVPQANPPPHLAPPMFSQMNSMSSAPQPISAPAPTIVSPPIISPPLGVVRPPPLQVPRPNFIPQQASSPEAWNPRPPIPPQPFPTQPNFSGGGFQVGQGDRVSPTWNPPSAPSSGSTSPGWNPPSGPQNHSGQVWNQPGAGPPPGSNWNPPVNKPEQKWGNQDEGSWNQPWDQKKEATPTEDESSANVSSLPPPPKGILRNRKSSLKEVPITPSESLEDNSLPVPPGEPPSPTEGKPKPAAKEKSANSAPDDHREFLEKLKKKTTGGAGSNLVSPPVMEENVDKAQAKSNVSNVPVMDYSENNNSFPRSNTGDQMEEEQSISKIETVRVERRYQVKHDDIRLPEKPSVHKDYRYEDNYERHDNYERPERQDNGGFRDDYGPPFRGGRGPPGPQYRHPGPYRGGRDSAWREPPYRERPGLPPPRHYYDQYNDHRRPYYY